MSRLSTFISPIHPRATAELSDVSDPPHLRPAEPDEAAALTDLALAAKESWGYDADFMARCRDIMVISPEAIARHPYYVIEDAAADLIGFYGFDFNDGLLTLDWLFVLPDAQGRGLGRRLFEHAVAVAGASGFGSFQITSDPHAEAFYQHLGARRCGSAPSDLYADRFLPILRYELVPAVAMIR